MTQPDPVHPTAGTSMAGKERNADARPQQAARVALTRGQRLLAVLTAAAILASGFNALVQVARALAEWKLQGR